MASAVELVHIPLNSGVHEEADKKMLPQGLLKTAKNVRLRKSAAFGVRYGFTATPATDDESAALQVFDVVSFDGTLTAFGTTNASAGGPERVFTYTGGKWRGESHGTSRPRFFSAITELAEVYRPPFAKTDESMRYDLAYANGFIALAYESHADEGSVFVSVFDPDTGAEVLQTEVASRSVPRVAAAGSVFVFAWVDTSGDVRAATFDPASSTALSAEATIHTAGTVTTGIDLASVIGASEVLLLVVRSDTHVATIRRLNSSLSVQATGTLTATTVALGSVVSVSGGSTSVAYVTTSNAYAVQTFATSTLTSTVGPTTLFGGATGTRPPGICRKNSTQFVCTAAVSDSIDQQLKVDVRAFSTHTAAAQYTQREVSVQSKPFVSPDEQFVGAVSPYGRDGLFNFTGIVDVEYGSGYECAHNRGFAVDALPDALGSVATDGTHYWAVFPVTDLNCSHTPVVMQFRAMSPERRQTATLGGLLYVAGGFVGVWDGQRMVESGFLDTPEILSAVGSVGAGSLSPSGLYLWVLTYEWYDGKGNLHLSPVSDPYELTLGASDNTATLTVSTPHSIRRALSSGTGSKLTLYRTGNARLTYQRTNYAFPGTTYAQTISITDTASDTEISTQAVVYTQGARGSLSGPLQHEAPFPAVYVWPTRERLVLGGLPNQSQWQQSKRAFPGEAIEFSNTPGFFGAIRGRQTGIAAQDDVDYVFARSEVFVVDGVGPDDNGNGEFNAPRKLPGDAVGCIDWRSIVADATGVWFQSHPDRLYRIPRGGGPPEWASQPVRDTLAAYPVITAAAVVAQDNVVCWAVRNVAGDEGRLVCRDSRTGEWYVDELTELGGAPIDAMCEHEGRLCIVVDGRVYLQDTTLPASAFIDYELELCPIAPNGTEGHAKVVGLTLTAEYRGDCVLDGAVSYDDDKTFVDMGPAKVVTGFASGDSLAFRWNPLRRKGTRFAYRFRVSALGGVASEGVQFNGLTLEVQRQRRARRVAVV